MTSLHPAVLSLVLLACSWPAAAEPLSFAHNVQEVAAAYGLDPELVHAVIGTESAYNPKATSPKGAMGLMQLMPDTARRFGVSNPYDPIQNLHGGARYLRWLLNFFQGDVQLALAGYNAGEGAVLKYGGIPPYRETVAYVEKVLGRWGKPTKATVASPLQPAAVNTFSPKTKTRGKPTLAPALNPYTADTTVFSRLSRITQGERHDDQQSQ